MQKYRQSKIGLIDLLGVGYVQVDSSIRVLKLAHGSVYGGLRSAIATTEQVG